MSSRNRSERRCAATRFRRAMRRGEAAMAPYMDKLDTDEGQSAMFVVVLAAQSVAMGIESPASLASAIQQASEISGIPPEVWDAHAQAMLAMHAGHQVSKVPKNAHDQTNPLLDPEKHTRLIAHTGSEIAPHIEKLCTPEGISGIVAIAIAAQSVASGEQDPEIYIRTIRLAAEVSGAPVSSLSAYGDLLMAMADLQMQSQPSSVGDNDA
jgi:hypothetical protein